MEYCNECHAVEQGTITKIPDNYSEAELIQIGMKALMQRNLTCDSVTEALEWGKDEVSYEICACCQSEDETMSHFDEDAGKDR